MDIKMRRKIHRFCGIALSACLLLGACITPALTGDAADKLSGNVAEETTATRNEKVSRNDLEPASETDLLSEETGDKTGGLTGQEEGDRPRRTERLHRRLRQKTILLSMREKPMIMRQ